jgi:hypothetical protein
MDRSQVLPFQIQTEGRFFEKFGYRTVPIEIGNHHEKNWKEQILSIREFCRQYLIPSNRNSKLGENFEKIGYLAQHSLFDQIPELKVNF